MGFEIRYGDGGSLFEAAARGGQADSMRKNAELALKAQAITNDAIQAADRNRLGYESLRVHADQQSAENETRANLQTAALDNQVGRDQFMADVEERRDIFRAGVAREHDERSFEQQRQMQLLHSGIPLTQAERSRMARLQGEMESLSESASRGHLADWEIAPHRQQIHRELSYLQAREQAAERHSVGAAIAREREIRAATAPGVYDPQSGVSTVDLGNGRAARLFWDGHRWTEVREPAQERDESVPRPQEIRAASGSARAEVRRELEAARDELALWERRNPNAPANDPNRPSGLPGWAMRLTEVTNPQTGMRMTLRAGAPQIIDAEIRRRMNERLNEQGFLSLEELEQRREAARTPQQQRPASAVAGFAGSVGRETREQMPAQPEDQMQALRDLLQQVANPVVGPGPVLARGATDEERNARNPMNRATQEHEALQNPEYRNALIARLRADSGFTMSAEDAGNRLNSMPSPALADLRRRSEWAMSLEGTLALLRPDRVEPDNLAHPGFRTRARSQPQLLLEAVDSALDPIARASDADRQVLRTLRQSLIGSSRGTVLDDSEREYFRRVITGIENRELEQRLRRLVLGGQ